jgi:hypothetical protein
MMRLCQADTSPQDAIGWLKQLAEFNESHPMVRERMVEWVDAINDLAVVVGFIQDLSSAISMPSVSRKKGQMFASRSQDLEAEVAQLKDQVDLLDFALPIDNLLEPGMAEGALKKLDQFLIDKLGTKMGFLYEDLVQECFAVLEEQYKLATAKREEQAKTAAIKRQECWTGRPSPYRPHSHKKSEPSSGDRRRRRAPPTLPSTRSPRAPSLPLPKHRHKNLYRRPKPLR